MINKTFEKQIQNIHLILSPRNADNKQKIRRDMKMRSNKRSTFN